jgi:nicotinate-nucleotide pyrophosphorylase (carboxylating)
VDEALRDLVARALAEDLGPGDITADAVVPADALATASIVQKEPGVLYGFDAAAEVFRQVGGEELEPLGAEREWRDEVPADVAAVRGPARALLAGERTALNLLCHLSGVATLTARFARAVEGTRATILDTRKTLPGLRLLEKYATRLGGAQNHRMGLWDAAMIKDNHVLVAGSVGQAVGSARAAGIERIICEVDRIEQIEPAIAAGATHLLLDNMDPATLREAVTLVAGRAATEASGGVTLETLEAIAATGVDFVSVGRLTQSAPAADIGLDFTAA